MIVVSQIFLRGLQLKDDCSRNFHVLLWKGVLSMKRYLEELIYSMDYDEFKSFMKSNHWPEEDIDEMWNAYH